MGAEHTPKNRLLTATRTRAASGAVGGDGDDSAIDAQRVRAVARAEYEALREATGGCGIALEGMLGGHDYRRG